MRLARWPPMQDRTPARRTRVGERKLSRQWIARRQPAPSDDQPQLFSSAKQGGRWAHRHVNGDHLAGPQWLAFETRRHWFPRFGLDGIQGAQGRPLPAGGYTVTPVAEAAFERHKAPVAPLLDTDDLCLALRPRGALPSARSVRGPRVSPS